VTDLAERFAALNVAWFEAALPPVRFRLSTRMTSTAGMFDPRKNEIAVASRFLDMHPEGVDELLLHEMVHVKTRDGHGPTFRREWERLRVAGAPVPAVYRQFRHCPDFAPLRPRPYRYLCLECGQEFPRAPPFPEARWCARCVSAARRRGDNPFAPHRRLVTA